MNQPDPQQYQQQPQPYPQQMPPGQYQQYPPQQGGSSGAKIAIIIVCVVVGVLFFGGLLVGILSVAMIPKLSEAKSKLELKQMGDLQSGLRNIAADAAKRRKLHSTELKDAAGEEFWIAALENEVIDDRLAPRLTSLTSSSDVALRDYRSGAPTPPGSFVSYTAPKASDLLSAMNKRGTERCVLITWNSRNWRNMAGDQVPVVWSDADGAAWMTFEEAQRDWAITRAEWDDPAGKLFGKKAPFDMVYE